VPAGSSLALLQAETDSKEMNSAKIILKIDDYILIDFPNLKMIHVIGLWLKLKERHSKQIASSTSQLQKNRGKVIFPPTIFNNNTREPAP